MYVQGYIYIYSHTSSKTEQFPTDKHLVNSRGGRLYCVKLDKKTMLVFQSTQTLLQCILHKTSLINNFNLSCAVIYLKIPRYQVIFTSIADISLYNFYRGTNYRLQCISVTISAC